ncbi:sigma factor-like helix-turn-helix DNA-binding protein [Paenibacillus sp. PDC88]|uniref:sigma factor-like helix-turn-helix DNA-binding protein n=1 Tax=Paenibacillus sp. PDC88 TaxID=1884375 RepID=UPI0008987D6C|nr:sigma factor-like helix-turn-helix DNA-binding protein [Paenibacillus sp. PDC88]SDX05227.1 hypothetical protein SAMN05518848_104204 [Paenibacillus sp. PDC88]
MNKDKVIEYLENFNSYQYAVNSIADERGGPLMPINMVSDRRVLPANRWDHRRYTLVVTMVKGAIDTVLSDDERSVIMQKYIDRNKKALHEIARYLHRDRGTISKWHTEALKKLCKALEPLDVEYTDIENIDYMWDPNWEYSEPA